MTARLLNKRAGRLLDAAHLASELLDGCPDDDDASKASAALSLAARRFSESFEAMRADAAKPAKPAPESRGLVQYRDTLNDGIRAASDVLAAWESGNLAGAVRDLGDWLEGARAVAASFAPAGGGK